MDSKSATPAFRVSLHGLPYAETVAANPPVRVTTSTAPQKVPSSTDQPSAHSLATLQPNQQDADWFGAGSGLKDSQTSVNTNGHAPSSLTSASSVPQIRVDEDGDKTPEKKWLSLKPSKSRMDNQSTSEPFQGIALDIPTGGLGEELSPENMKFSNRGSMFIDGKTTATGRNNSPKKLDPISDNPRARHLVQSRISAKVMSTDEEMLSEKVRSFYAAGSDSPYDSDANSTLANRIGLRWQDAVAGQTEASSVVSLSRATSTTDLRSENASQKNGDGHRVSSIRREDHELAGGVEDWQDVDNADVDRYGFILPKLEASNGLNRSLTSRDAQRLQRVSTSLQLASETPRRKNTLRRATSSSQRGLGIPRISSDLSLKRTVSSQSANVSKHSTFRSRHRKLMDEAGDMLTLPRTASALIESGKDASDDPRARRKEIEREEKWRKMARAVEPKALGGGMSFHFDTDSPKLIERTWKGIPDKWRATAWHAFLSKSAKKRDGGLSDEDLISAFNDYQAESSPDDVQIDIDVPRTISSHIMFRRRYRGGQRLLFRVLHAMSLHFAEIGYVQGMAALAATLLAYYEEEKAFVMLVRLWELRGLEALYKSGFGGLMAALDDFEKHWLGTGELCGKLTDLGIGPTAYGTRWYLTLFNYSIPFPAQLRVWDVFMLLGDDLDLASGGDPGQFGTTLDVLHATSAALIDGMRDILLESDFENAMKVLTSWVPIKDEDLFMRVAKAEWKMHKRKA